MVLCGATEERISCKQKKNLPLRYHFYFCATFLSLICVSLGDPASQSTRVGTYLGGEDFDNSTRALSKPSPPKYVTAEHCHRAERSSGNP